MFQPNSDTEESNFRAHLLSVLSAILSPDQNARLAAEQQLKVLDVTEDIGVHLAELTVDSNGDLAVRQLASLILKQYVTTHWSNLGDKFSPPVTSEPAKIAIRKMLPLALRDDVSKIRSSVAYAMSAVAHWDWPEEWEDLFPQLMEAITSGERNWVHGAMRVLTEFSRDLTDRQMPQIAPIILPELFKIFVQPEVYSIRTRSRAVEIFNTCLYLVYSTDDAKTRSLLKPEFVSEFTHAFAKSIEIPNGPISDCGLKKEVLKTLVNMMRFVPHQMGESVPQVLTAVWQQLIQGASYFVSREVNCSEADSETVIDSDGESLSFGNLVYSIFDFVESLLDSRRSRKIVKNSLSELIYYLVIYMQITQDQVSVWMQNPDQFVEDEDEESFSFSIRISAQDLFMACCKEFKKESATAIVSAIHRHLSEAEAKKNNGDPYWWKLHEACYLAMGSVRNLLEESSKKSTLQFDFSSFLTQVVLNDLKESPLVAGRALWIGSRFASMMPPEIMKQFLEATVHALQPEQSPVIKISAVRAVFAYCDHLEDSQLTLLLLPYLPNLLEGLLHLVAHSTVEVLSLVLETMRVVLSINSEVTMKYQEQVIPLATAVFLKYTHDPLITSLAADLLTEIASHEQCSEQLQTKLLPTLVSIINSPPEKVPNGLISSAMDILCNVVRKVKPLSTVFVSSAFPAVVKCAINSDDNEILQSAGECVRAYISVAIDQLFSWHDSNGNSGVFYCLQMISLLLSNKLPEHSASFAGRLVSVFISQANDKLSSEDIDMILRAVLSKLQQSVTLTVAQSLILIFAHLVHSKIESVISFLSSVPGPTGDSALHFVMSEWCEKQNMFYGSYDKKVSITALAKLLQYGLESNNEQLKEITVRGEQIFKEGIRTRSKSQKEPEKWTVIPLFIKIYKLLLGELQNQIDSNSQGNNFFTWEDASDEDEEVDPGDGRQTLEELLNENSVIGGGGYADDDEFSEDDEDAANDPLNSVNIEEYLKSFVLEFSHTEMHHTFFVPHLSLLEQDFLTQCHK